MGAIDFSNSYITWWTLGKTNIARFKVDAVCTVFDESKEGSEAFFLVAPCRSEHMYRDGNLFIMPNYEWRVIFSATHNLVLRKHWVSEPDYLDDKGLNGTGGRELRHLGLNHEDYEDHLFDVRSFTDTRRLSDEEQIVEQTLANVPLVGRTELHDEGHRLRAVLEYPIVTMNVREAPPRFQVDTGPLIVPDFESTGGHPIERLDIAHVVYNVFDKGEFVLRRPRAFPEGDESLYSVTDYTLIKVLPARNEILCPA